MHDFRFNGVLYPSIMQCICELCDWVLHNAMCQSWLHLTDARAMNIYFHMRYLLTPYLKYTIKVVHVARCMYGAFALIIRQKHIRAQCIIAM